MPRPARARRGAIDAIITDGVILLHSVPREFIAAQFGIERRFDGGNSFGGVGVACEASVSGGQIGKFSRVGKE